MARTMLKKRSVCGPLQFIVTPRFVFEVALQSSLIGSDFVLLPGDVILQETPGFPNGFIPVRD